MRKLVLIATVYRIDFFKYSFLHIKYLGQLFFGIVIPCLLECYESVLRVIDRLSVSRDPQEMATDTQGAAAGQEACYMSQRSTRLMVPEAKIWPGRG